MQFRDVIGHEGLIRRLSRSVAHGTLPSSLVYAGPEGVGKRTVALAVASALNCEQPVVADGAADSCGACRTCRRIARYVEELAAGRQFALDCVRWVRPDEKASIKIDVVRDVIGRVGYRPADGRRRVVILDEADTLEVASQQSLLKVLEEPPPSSVFALVTARPDALLPTIRSRCPRLGFSGLPVEVMARALVERFGYDEAAAVAAAGMSGGSLGRALSRGADRASDARVAARGFLDAVAAAGDNVAERLGAAAWLVSRDGAARKGSATRVEIGERLDALASLARDVSLVATSAEPRWLANADLADWLAATAKALGPRRAHRAFSTVDRAQVALDRNASFKPLAAWLACHL